MFGSIIALTYSSIKITGIVYKEILKENRKRIYKKLALNSVLIIVSIEIAFKYTIINPKSFVEFIIYGIMVSIIVIVSALGINFVFYKSEILGVLNYVKSIGRKMDKNRNKNFHTN